MRASARGGAQRDLPLLGLVTGRSGDFCQQALGLDGGSRNAVDVDADTVEFGVFKGNGFAHTPKAPLRGAGYAIGGRGGLCIVGNKPKPVGFVLLMQ